MSAYIDNAPVFVVQGVHRDAIVYHPAVVTMLKDAGVSGASAVVDSLVLMRVWKWNWVRDAGQELRRFSAEQEPLPWVRLTYDDIAEQVGITVGRARDAVRRLTESGLLLSQIVGHPDHGSQKYYLVNWTTVGNQHPGVLEINTPPVGNQHPYIEIPVDTNTDTDQALSSGRSLATTTGVDNDMELGRLCRLLAAAVEQQRGSRPKVTAQWLKQMDLLLRRGPKNIEGPPPTIAEIEYMIGQVFTRLANPDRKGFCWADQIRSPTALRDHWDQLRVALTRLGGGGAPPANDDEISEAVRRMKEHGL